MNSRILFLMLRPRWGIDEQLTPYFGGCEMPTYRKNLPAQGKHQGFDLKRTPETGSLQAIVTSEDLLVCDTHFFHGRTTPCERVINDQGNTVDDTQCAACVDKIAYRCHVYVSAFDAKRGDHYIFECTANAAKSMEEYRNATGTLRGCVIYATRPKGQKNSKVCIETSSVNLAKVKIPPGPDLIRALAVIWRLPGVGLEEKKNGKKNGRIHTINNRIKEMNTQPDNMPDPERLGDFLEEALKL
jgi:hypothetical protein